MTMGEGHELEAVPAFPGEHRGHLDIEAVERNGRLAGRRRRREAERRVVAGSGHAQHPRGRRDVLGTAGGCREEAGEKGSDNQPSRDARERRAVAHPLARRGRRYFHATR